MRWIVACLRGEGEADSPEARELGMDISATLFLAAPEEYDGGELLVEDTYGVQRVTSFFWIQSFVREDAQRALLFDLDMAIIRLTREHPGDPALVALTGVYHNLMRMWTLP